MIYSKGSVSVYQGSFQGIPAAVKFMYLQPTEDIQKYEREYQTLIPLQHASIIRIFDYAWIVENQARYLIIVTELCKKDLDTEIKERQQVCWFWNESELRNTLQTIVAPLAFMQRQGFSHRDLKPANIFIGFDDAVKLGDFGSATFTSAQNLDLLTLAGTPFFLSPKLKAGLANGYKVVDHNTFKSDVYSLGMTFLTMAKLTEPLNMVFTATGQDSLELELSTLSYSEDFKGILRWMMTQEEDQRCDFLMLEQYIQGTYATYLPQNQAPGLVVPALVNQETIAKESDECEKCKASFNLVISGVMYTWKTRGSKYHFCSEKCLEEFKSQEKKVYHCSNCHAELNQDTANKIEQVLKTDFMVIGDDISCPTCKTVLSVEDFQDD